MTVTKFDAPLDAGFHYLVKFANAEVEGLRDGSAYTAFMKRVMERIEDQFIADVYPMIRERAMERFANTDTVIEEIAKAVRARLADSIFPVKP